MFCPGAGNEETCITCIAGGERFREFGANFIVGLRDGGAYGGPDIAATGAQRLHRGECGIENAVDGAFPACMCCPDNAGVGVGEENRCAVCGEDPQCQAGPVGYHGVGLWRGIVLPALGNGYDGWRMYLVGGDEMGARYAQIICNPAPIFDHVCA